jgi:menaquinone-dependent protoporphyrinogen IX oxidase
MVGVRTLIAYATKSGVNAESANMIAEILRKNYGMDVTVADLKNGMIDIAPYKNVIVGAGIRMGSVYKEAVEFLGKNFGERKVALFFSCLEGGVPKRHDAAIVKNTAKALAKNPGLKPIDIGTFGGCMKFLGKTTDNRNPERVKEWANELGKKLAN